jgi:hypothetical protein
VLGFNAKNHFLDPEIQIRKFLEQLVTTAGKSQQAFFEMPFISHGVKVGEPNSTQKNIQLIRNAINEMIVRVEKMERLLSPLIIFWPFQNFHSSFHITLTLQ